MVVLDSKDENIFTGMETNPKEIVADDIARIAMVLVDKI